MVTKQKVLVTDKDFQNCAVQLGLSPEGITAKNFDERLIEAERLEYASELGLPNTATWREIRDTRRARDSGQEKKTSVFARAEAAAARCRAAPLMVLRNRE